MLGRIVLQRLDKDALEQFMSGLQGEWALVVYEDTSTILCTPDERNWLLCKLLYNTDPHIDENYVDTKTWLRFWIMNTYWGDGDEDGRTVHKSWDDQAVVQNDS